MPKVIKDVLYSYIKISPLAQSIIDKPEFQRLRQLKQIGVAQYVFPSATHTRFEHSIGTYHLAGQLLSQLDQPDVGVTPRLRDLIQVGALVHDLGHVAFSHLFDHCLSADLGVPHHEERSVELFRFMVAKYPDIKLSPEELDLICHIITGEPLPQHPPWVFEIVANSVYQLDVDKCDYLVRDAYHLGINSPLQVDRIFLFARVLENHVCYQKKTYLQIMDVFMTRYRFHKEVYRHHAVIGIELVMVQILKILAEIMDWKTLFQTHQWHHITDSIVDVIPLLHFDDPAKQDRLQQARLLLEKIQTRQFYKRVPSDKDGVSVKSILGFSSKTDNPMDKILFYDATLTPHTIKPNEISKLLSNTSHEVEESVYRV